MAKPIDGARRTLLLVAGGRDALPAVQEAHALGVRVIVADRDPAAPGVRVADGALVANIDDPDATVEAVRAYAAHRAIDGVLAVGADVPETVAAIADVLGLPGHSLAAARLLGDRLAMKERFRATGVPTPWYAPVEDAACLDALVRRAGRSLVLKPADARGARGVIRLLPDVDRAWAHALVSSESPSGRVMVEEFIPGRQISVEAVIIDGCVVTLGHADRSHQLLERFAPFVLDDGSDSPTTLARETIDAIDAQLRAAIAALGLRSGVVKGEIVIGPEGPMVMELSGQLPRGFSCSHEIPLATGVNLLAAAIRLALGEAVAAAELTPRWSRAVSQRYLFPGPGRVVSVSGVDEVAMGEGIALLEMGIAPGAAVRPMTQPVCRGGVVIAVGDTREQATQRATAAAARVRIVTQPLVLEPLRVVH